MPSRIVDSDGVADEFEVGADGTLAAYRNRLGDVTRFEYSPAGAITTRYLPDGRAVGYERDDAGRLLAMVNPAGERGELTYTAGGSAAVDPGLRRGDDQPRVRRRRPAAPGGRRRRRGNRLRVRRRAARRRRAVRQRRHGRVRARRLGRETAVDLDGSRWTIDPDRAGRVVKLTDSAGVEAEAEHDPLGQWTSIADSTGQRWQLERGLIDRVRRLRTPTGEHEATYTAEGLLASTSSSDGRPRTSATPRLGGSPRSPRAGSGSSTATTPRGGCPVSTAGPAGGCSSTTPTAAWCDGWSPAGREQRYGYDVRGNPASITVGSDTWSFEHDARRNGSAR